jgi:MoxR-like ATPase
VTDPIAAATILDQALAANLSVLMTGAPSTGKTSLAEQAAARAGMRVVTVYASSSDPTDVKGIGVIDPETSQPEWRVCGDFRALFEDVPTLLLIDELGQGSPAVQAALAHVILARTAGGQRISDAVRIVACTNRSTDAAGVSGMLTMLRSRFNLLLELELTLDAWQTWAAGASVHPAVIGFVRLMPDTLAELTASRDIVPESCGRALESLSRLLTECVFTDPRIRAVAVQAAIGRRRGLEFLAFENLLHKLPDIDAALADPRTWAFQLDPRERNYVGLAAALCAGIAYRMTPANSDNADAIIQTLPADYQILAWHWAVRRNPKLAQTPSWGAHRTRNQAAYM